MFVYHNGFNLAKLSVTAAGTAALSTAQFKFGTSSLRVTGATTSYASVNNAILIPPQRSGTSGDFTIECWVYPISTIAGQTVYSTDNNGLAVTSNPTSGGSGVVGSLTTAQSHVTYINGGTSFGVISLNTWNCVCVQRKTGMMYVYLNGVSACPPVSAAINFTPTLPFGKIGTDNTTASTNGYIDEFRISDIARYPTYASEGTNVYTPATSQFTTDSNTKLLLHFDGANGSTDFVMSQ